MQSEVIYKGFVLKIPYMILLSVFDSHNTGRLLNSTQIARKIDATQSQTVLHINQLIEKNILQKHIKNKREFYIDLTENGLEFLKQISIIEKYL